MLRSEPWMRVTTMTRMVRIRSRKSSNSRRVRPAPRDLPRRNTFLMRSKSPSYRVYSSSARTCSTFKSPVRRKLSCTLVKNSCSRTNSQHLMKALGNLSNTSQMNRSVIKTYFQNSKQCLRVLRKILIRRWPPSPSPQENSHAKKHTCKKSSLQTLRQMLHYRQRSRIPEKHPSLIQLSWLKRGKVLKRLVDSNFHRPRKITWHNLIISTKGNSHRRALVATQLWTTRTSTIESLSPPNHPSSFHSSATIIDAPVPQTPSKHPPLSSKQQCNSSHSN